MQLHIIDQYDHTLFVCKDMVNVTGTNLIAECERLEVTTTNQKVKNNNLEKQNTNITKIKADESVKIQQLDRIATADSALILPNDGRIELEGDASVTDHSGTASGHRIVINQGESRAQVEAGDGQRAKVTLPELGK